MERGTAIDEEWDSAYGEIQKTEDNAVYYGSVLEHLLLQNLCAFYEVGDHNIIRLRGADWNDALDMAEEKGESVAFTCAYAGNLRQLADYLKALEKQCGCTEIEILEEMHNHSSVSFARAEPLTTLPTVVMIFCIPTFP